MVVLYSLRLSCLEDKKIQEQTIDCLFEPLPALPIELFELIMIFFIDCCSKENHTTNSFKTYWSYIPWMSQKEDPIQTLKNLLKNTCRAMRVNKTWNMAVTDLLDRALSDLSSKNKEYFTYKLFEICNKSNLGTSLKELQTIKCLLLLMGIQIKQNGQTPLHCASLSKNKNALNRILNYMNKFTEEEQEGIFNHYSLNGNFPPLFEAIFRHDKEIVQILLNHISKLSSKTQTNILKPQYSLDKKPKWQKKTTNNALIAAFFGRDSSKPDIKILNLILEHISKLEANHQKEIIRGALGAAIDYSDALKNTEILDAFINYTNKFAEGTKKMIIKEAMKDLEQRTKDIDIVNLLKNLKSFWYSKK